MNNLLSYGSDMMLIANDGIVREFDLYQIQPCS